MENELKELVGTKEKILYEGRPSKKCFIFESIFNPLLPFAIVWALFDSFFIGAAFMSKEPKILYFIIPFMLLHLMPVWMYLGGVIFTFRKYRNTYYIVTDKAVYISSGIFTKVFNQKPFAELSHIDLHRGIFDQMFNVADIILTSSHNPYAGGRTTITLESIDNYTDLYNRIKKLQQDIYTDVMYPNDKRPSENHGYNTEYKE